MSRLVECFGLIMFLQNESSIATRYRKPFCSGFLVIVVRLILLHIHGLDDIHIASRKLRCIFLNAGSWHLVGCPLSKASYGVSYTVTIDLAPCSAHLFHHSLATDVGILNVEVIVPCHVCFDTWNFMADNRISVWCGNFTPIGVWDLAQDVC